MSEMADRMKRITDQQQAAAQQEDRARTEQERATQRTLKEVAELERLGKAMLGAITKRGIRPEKEVIVWDTRHWKTLFGKPKWEVVQVSIYRGWPITRGHGKIGQDPDSTTDTRSEWDYGIILSTDGQLVKHGHPSRNPRDSRVNADITHVLSHKTASTFFTAYPLPVIQDGFAELAVQLNIDPAELEVAEGEA